MSRPPESITADQQVARIFEWRRGFNTIHLIDVGVRLGVFSHLRQNGPQSAAVLAEVLRLHPPYVATWCLTAYGMQLLDAEADGRYRLAPFMDAILGDSTHPRYLGGYVRLGTEVAAEDFRLSPDAFRDASVRPFQGRGEAFARAIAESTQGLQVAAVKKMLPGLPGLADRLAAGGTLLEIGCGTGSLLLLAAKAFPAARLAGVDIDADSLEVAGRKMKEAGLDQRVTLRLGAPGEVIEPGTVDAVVMIEVLHEIAPAIRPGILAGSFAALSPGGWLLIVDETYPGDLEEARRPEFRFPLQTGFEELLWGNVIPTRMEQESLLRGAGFTGEIQRSVIGEGFTVLACRK